ncbi:hypothetical protein CRE_00619 [Caenorhabditis remanei]|uniref:3-oxo-5-alpha-steroid 4-dehydrogenase C-terminal domain-containing protein n=1 Tax=Caenorhabditis remanei TaxID=31234 RepID=E3LDH3_CAERE|nr:hypothetical protein CRE_00619 [Caenorhabditis remanei]
MIDNFSAAIFVIFGLLRLFVRQHTRPALPFLEDVRSCILADSRFPTSLLAKFLIPVVLSTFQSFRAGCALTVLLVAMWTDDYQYPPIKPPRNRHRFSAYCTRIVSYEIIVGVLIWVLFKQKADVYSNFTIFEIIFGFYCFWFGYLGKVDYDEVMHFPHGLPNRIFPVSFTFDLLNQITGPDYQRRIIQWYGFGLLAGNGFVYAFVFYEVCNLASKAYTRHRINMEEDPNQVDDGRTPLLQRLFESFDNAYHQKKYYNETDVEKRFPQFKLNDEWNALIDPMGGVIYADEWLNTFRDDFKILSFRTVKEFFLTWNKKKLSTSTRTRLDTRKKDEFTLRIMFLSDNSPGNHYIIGSIPTKNPNILVGGCGSGSGFKVAPGIGKALAEMAAGKKTTVDVSFFSADRFKSSKIKFPFSIYSYFDKH